MIWTNRYNLSRAIVDVITQDDYEYSKEPNHISVTSLIDSPKIRVLKIKHGHEMTEDVADNIWRFFGNMGHQVMQSISSKDRMMEVRINEEIDGWILSGKPDIYDKLDKTITDYKFTSVWSYIFAGDKKNWERQLNIYAYLVRGQGFEVKKLINEMFLRDWKITEYRKSPDTYPKCPVASIKQKVWSDVEVESYIHERLRLHKEALEKDPDELECNSEERWEKKSDFAVMSFQKNGEMKKRADRKFDTREQAEYYAKDYTEKYEIIERKGSDVRCEAYCSCRHWCNYYKEKFQEEK